MADNAQTYEFKAEVKQLLDILVHSLYTNKEIFLRELASNASDALDKLKFEAAREGWADEVGDLRIDISLDKDAKTLTVADTGVGMTRDELVDNIGTIAHSGSADFVKAAAEEKGGLEGLIGRFGVGFYSVYMAADKVEVTTNSYKQDQPALRWISDGKGSYEIEPVEGDVPRGTSILVHLREELADEFTDKEHITGVVKRHSNFISHPIFVDGDRVNTVPALWREPKFNVKPEQYEEFYKFLTYDAKGPFETMHVSVDAPVQFNALMFIPEKDWDIFGMNREEWGLDLYVRRVLIQHKNKDLLPQYLGFVRGVVDTEDLPLNISRETLQDSLLIRKIENNLTKHVLSHLKKLADKEPERYAAFWREHAKVFKLGYGDYVNRESFADLVRFNSSASENAEGLASLADYVSRAREGQKAIYYAFGPSRQAVEQSPHLEAFRAKGIEVLYLFEPIDEFIMDSVKTYKEFQVKSVELADVQELDEVAGEADASGDKAEDLDEKGEASFEALAGRMKGILGDKVSEVRRTRLLSSSPCRLVNPDGAMTSSMERVMRVISKDTSIPTKVLEVNASHPLIMNLMRANTDNSDDEFVETATRQLYESALLLEGYLQDPHALVGRMQDLLTKASDWYAQSIQAKK